MEKVAVIENMVQYEKFSCTFDQALKNLGLEDTYIPASGIPITILMEMFRLYKDNENGYY